ncbi:hypothetical protein, partial [Proteus genomosp. 4]|uniref:hypothetical protein n=1 Tax=Proteus genomosp. 4 TaxID=1311818 RepID=UPI001ABF34BA
SEFGPDYQANYIINLEDVKQATGRERITESMLSDYINYLNNHGFVSYSDGRFIYLSVSARTVVPVGNEAIRLGNALNVFRTRAQMNGDYNNL